MPLMKIPSRVLQIVSVRINELFDNVKLRLLGERGAGKTLSITANKSLSVPGIYEAALIDEGGDANIETLNSLIGASKNYLDALKLKAINQVVNDLTKHVEAGNATAESLEAVLVESWGKITSHLATIVDSEVQVAKNTGLLAGIIKSNASFGIDDPMVMFITAKDNLVCEECKTLHLMEDGITPRIWYLSEVSRGYHKRGEAAPSLHGCHPSCRCQMTTILPGYGFNDLGRVSFVKRDYNPIEEQRKK